MKRYTGINHLAMVTNDMDKTIRFWRDLLGMRLVAGLGDSHYRHYFFEISEHDMIAFFEWPNVENVEIKDHGMPVKGPLSFDHISIGVENDDALWEIRDRIEATGAWVSEAVNHGFIHSIYTFDPNNIPLEFSAPVHDVYIRKWPKMKDRNPVEAALEGPEPRSGYWPEVVKPTPEKDREIYPGEGIALAND